MNKKQKKNFIRIIVASILFILFIFLPISGFLKFILYLGLYIEIGYDILKKAWKGILNHRIFDENFLMTIATLGAFALAIFEKSQDYSEAIGVMLFYQIGEFFQSVAIGRSRQNISELMDIRPDYANIEIDGIIQKVDPDEIEIGSVITVLPGEKVPIDGIVSEGSSSLNTSALTGESLPRDVKVGDEIFSGCINLTSVLKIKTTKEFCDSTVSKILELVEESSSRKSKSENFISKFARYYTPFVCYSALLLAFIPPLISLIIGINPSFNIWLYRALTFLVISCPCALVISIPLSFFAGIGCASHEGILIKGSNYLEALSDTKIIVFDKTGTLTKGVFEVTEIHNKDISNEDLLFYAAHVESSSSHPISRSIISCYGKNIDRTIVTDIEELSGHGITAKVNNISVAAGNIKLMNKLGLLCDSPEGVGTVIHLSVDNKYAGYILISDVIKDNSASAIQRLKKAGIEKTVMLTGDASSVASQVAELIGIDEYHADLLPSEKVCHLEKLLSAESSKNKTAFVGDGINDAPVLTRADIGIAMGGLGSDAAIEAADVVLMDDDPMQISKAILISKKCLRIVYQNIIFALLVKAICLIFGALGLANMWLAIFADVGVMIIAVLNAIRALRIKM